MSDIRIRRLHHMRHDEARSAAEAMAQRLKKDFQLDYAWKGDVLEFERPGLNGELKVAPGHLEMEVRLGFLLRMMKPKIEKGINESLDQMFAAAPSGKKPKDA